MTAGVVSDVKMASSVVCYTGDDKEGLISIIKEKLVPLVAYQKGNKYLCGDSVSWLDFYFWEMLQCHIYFHSDIFKDFPELETYHMTMRSLPGLKDYLDNPDSIDNDRLFNNKVAKINGTVKQC